VLLEADDRTSELRDATQIVRRNGARWLPLVDLAVAAGFGGRFLTGRPVAMAVYALLVPMVAFTATA
jgi:hypothetical protein